MTSPPPTTPCNGCIHLDSCAAYPALESSIYSNPAFTRTAITMPGASGVAIEKVRLLRDITSNWLATGASAGITQRTLLPALFDVLMSALYAMEANIVSSARPAIAHPVAPGRVRYFYPYIWMCPGCVAEGRSPAESYLDGGVERREKVYPDMSALWRPGGRAIGDLGAIALRVILEALVSEPARFTSGGGHRGEFDVVISTQEALILGEIKASPLICFPLVYEADALEPEHGWHTPPSDGAWGIFLGASSDEKVLPIRASSNDPTWPLAEFARLAEDATSVKNLAQTWASHLNGYVKFNAESATTRWHRFGCGNIETKIDGKRKQLRVDNTKSLPGIDRTDDIKKGLAQVMLFDRLKRGCAAGAVKTVLLGNLFAETHHEHYLKPLASLKLAWEGHDPVWLFDAIIALSRNIINDPTVARTVPLESTPYVDQELIAEAFHFIIEEPNDDE